ncbi:MAG: FliI/YscN family ATPase [Sedimentisphaerales bacterium]|jgi:flagellum-specific ATP synthase|nr:FliI/YscN family ATPase [Sedimentisphaerales bacterium]HNY79282.1 FliI/YscN family ATPase [Sedimentisphaerales bacterium]HOC64520.1 FliI/YscN family ATPase [Sedimentisphaerales bacterium]HOH63383.1 FliI/YscN family ATPase [Sedimentisphaerales bacterium]HPY48825.1 FliI/YscN family ATPase [Sedimentisphaerales bacterium]
MIDSNCPTIDFDKYRSALETVDLVDCQGYVVRVSGSTIESAGPSVGLGELCGIHIGTDRRVLAEVVGFRHDHVILLPLEHIEGVCPGDVVTARTTPRHIMLSPKVLGRVLNGLGEPIDNKGPLLGDEKRPLDVSSPPPLSRERITRPLALGIRSIDGILTCGQGQRVGIFAGSGVGKSVLLGDIANGSDAAVNVVALIGERGREVREFLEENLGPEGLARSVVVVATSDVPPIQRVKAAFVAVTVAEYFRDKAKNVLFMMDSLTRFAQAQREIGLAAGEPPATKGYCPSVFSLMPRLIERLGCAGIGSITGILTVLVENDDLTDPVADSARSLLDGHIVLSRKLASRGHYPAVDISQSVSRLMSAVVSEEHLAAAQKLREIYATYADAEDLINIGAFSPGSNRRIDGAISLIDRINEFLVQPVRQRTPFEETVRRLTEIRRVWDQLLSPDKARV